MNNKEQSEYIYRFLPDADQFIASHEEPLVVLIDDLNLFWLVTPERAEALLMCGWTRVERGTR